MAKKYDGGGRPCGLPHLVKGHAGGRVGVDPAQGQPLLPGDALDEVAVGWKVVGVEDNFSPRRILDRG
jgi:hypothetical protein